MIVDINPHAYVLSDVFMPKILLEAKGVSEAIAEEYLYDIVIDVCEQTGILQRTLSTELYPCETEYRFDVPDCERIIRFKKICIGNTELDLSALRNVSCAGGACCGNYSLRFVPPDTLIVGTSASHGGCSGQLSAAVITAPKRESCRIPEILYERYKDVIIAGVLARLFMITDIDNRYLAERKLQEYSMGVRRMRRDVVLAYGPGKVKIRPTLII